MSLIMFIKKINKKLQCKGTSKLSKVVAEQFKSGFLVG